MKTPLANLFIKYSRKSRGLFWPMKRVSCHKSNIQFLYSDPAGRLQYCILFEWTQALFCRANCPTQSALLCLENLRNPPLCIVSYYSLLKLTYIFLKYILQITGTKRFVTKDRYNGGECITFLQLFILLENFKGGFFSFVHLQTSLRKCLLCGAAFCGLCPSGKPTHLFLRLPSPNLVPLGVTLCSL